MSQPLNEAPPRSPSRSPWATSSRLFEAQENGAELPVFHGEVDFYRKDGSERRPFR